MTTDFAAIADKIAGVAPLLATLIGGPVGAAASAGIAILSNVLGTKDAHPLTMDAALSADPEALAKVRIAEIENTAALQALTVQAASAQLTAQTAQYQAEVQDRDSAREREIAIKDWTPRVLAYGVTIGFFGVLFIFMTMKIEPALMQLLTVMVSSLATVWICIMGYYFGSSLGSKIKDSTISQRFLSAVKGAP
jgi:hypothetical protein